MKLLLDEHYSPEIARQLRAKGHDVEAVKERPELAGLDDPALLTKATEEQRALVTEDVGDFVLTARHFAADGRDHHGLIFSPSKTMPRSPNTVGVFVSALEALLRAKPAPEAMVDDVRWLRPPG